MASVKCLPDALPVQALVHEHGHNQRINDRNRGGLGRREHAANDAEDDDDDCGQRPDRGAQLLHEALQAERRALRVVALDGDDVGADHQAGRQQRARQVAGQEQAAHGDAARGRRVDDHVVARRNEQALAGGGDGDGDGEIVVVALADHHRDEDGAQGRGVRRRGAGDAAKEVGRDDVDHRQAAAHPADQRVRQRDQLIGDAAGAHEHAHGDEERHGHQGERTDAFHQQPGDGDQGVALNQQTEHGGKANGVGNGEPQENHQREASQQYQNGKRLSIHYA